MFTRLARFSTAQLAAINKAVSNWEQIITQDKDSTGSLNIALTRDYTMSNGGSWGRIWAQSSWDYYANLRIDWENSLPSSGGMNYHNRVRYNSGILDTLSSNLLIRLTMHEIGHALGLDDAQNDALLGLDSIMDLNGLHLNTTEDLFQRLD